MIWRPTSKAGVRFRVGAMRERIDIQAATETLDAAGQTIRTWSTTYSKEPAQRIPIRGSEGARGSQVESGIDEVFIIRFCSSLVPQMRIVHGSRTYGIVYVEEVEGGRRYMSVACKAVL